ncbi:MAG: type II toxin-antitoxin system HicB family antitoxin [Pyrinomonadaceae bacterium]
MNIKVLVEPGEDGYFVAHVPSLKSCWSQGKTKEEALENIREAIDLYLEPEPTELSQSSQQAIHSRDRKLTVCVTSSSACCLT